MRLLVLGLGLIASLAALGAGAYLIVDLQTEAQRTKLGSSRKATEGPELSDQKKADIASRLSRQYALPFFLLAAGVLGIVGAFLASDGRGVLASGFLLLAVVGPAVFAVGLWRAEPVTVPGPRGALGPTSFPLNSPKETEKALVLASAPAGLLVLTAVLALFVRRRRPRPVTDAAPFEGHKGQFVAAVAVVGLLGIAYLAALAAALAGYLDPYIMDL